MRFEDELAAFRARTADPGFEGLIVLGTERHNITAALLLGTLQPCRVAFLTTPETRDFPQYIANLLDTSSTVWDIPEHDHGDTAQVYTSVKALRTAWREIADPARIAVDVTGGRKPMSVGLEKAAHILGLTTIYVESDYWPSDSGRRGPIPATQRLVIPPNPYLVFGDLEAAEARRLYSSHDYAGAQRLYATLAARVPPPASTRYAALAELAGAYAAWDAFDLPEAHATLARLREMDAREQWAPDALARIEWQHAALARLNSAHVRLNDTPFAILANDPEAVLALLGSLYANALRREAQGRYDVAALLLYRCLELMSQRRLAGLGIDADAERITLMKGYGLLETRRDPLVWSPAGSAQGQPRLLDRIRATTAARNKSMLAHGFRLIRREQEYLPFRAVVDDVFDRFFAAEQVSVHLGLMRAAWHALFQAAEPE